MAQDIAGYDMVMAITQGALNKQFQLVFPNGKGLASWNATLADDGSQVQNVVFGTPSVDLSTPLARGAAILLPVTSGNYVYYQVKIQDGKPVVTPVTQDLTGTTVRVTASLTQFHDTTYHSSDFTMQRIFMDLTDPNLDTDFTINLQGQALVSLTTLLRDYLNQLHAQNNASFLFGSVKVPTVPEDVGPLAPKAFDFSVNSQAANPNNNTLNFLLTVDSAQLPTGTGVGVLPNNLTTPGNDAAFLVSDYQVLEKFVLPSVVTGIHNGDTNSHFGIDSFAVTHNPARASLTGNVDYKDGWFSKFDVYVASGEVTMDIEFRQERRVIIDTVTGIGDVSAYIAVYVNAGQLDYKSSQTQPSVHSEGSSTVWRIFQDIFTLGFAEIGEKVVSDAVSAAVSDLLSPGNLSTSINAAIQLIELPAPTLFAYTAAFLPDNLHIDVTLKAQGPA